MQVGCDPKHNSTCQLLGGRTRRTVLDCVRETLVARRRLGDVLETGSMEVLYAESGGLEPSIGCARREILAMFDTLGRLYIDSVDADFKIYNVLGDVVRCGFAIPLGRDHVDTAITVTSGELVPMYAVNNIMKVMGNFDAGRPRLLGLVLNSRGTEGEEEAVGASSAPPGRRSLWRSQGIVCSQGPSPEGARCVSSSQTRFRQSEWERSPMRS